MAADNYKVILQEVCEKLNNIESVNQTDVLNIKNSIETIESLMSDTQAKLNFQDIKDKLESLSNQVVNCNDGILKDLFNDINSLKETTGNVGKYLENIQNTQNFALTSAEFEEFQKQQLDLALKTNENIFNELNAIKQNIPSTPTGESVKNLEEQLSSIHQNLSDYIENLVKKVPDIPSLDEIGAIMSDLNSVHQKNIKQTNQLVKDLISKFDNLEDKLENKEIEAQLLKINEIYDSLNIISVWVEKVGYINQAIDNVYNRLGESIDFDEVSEKVDIIYENITALNNWSMKIDNIDENTSLIKSQISSLNDFQNTTKDITDALVEVKTKLSTMSLEGVDFDDFANKIDLIYENIGMLNDWVGKIDDIVQRSKELDLKFQKTGDSLSLDLKEINDNLTFNLQEVKDNLNLDINEINDNLSLKLKDVKDNLNNKLQEVDANINLNINEFKDNLNNKLQEVDDKINFNLLDTKNSIDSKLEEITQSVDSNLANTDKIVSDIPDIKTVLENLSNDLQAIISPNSDDEKDSYIYNLMDIESDFLKLHKSLDVNRQMTSKDINSIKENFNQLNEDISSISIRTNKLILSADDANKEFRTYLESFKNLINSFELKSSSLDNSDKFNLLCTKITEMLKLLNNSVNANNNLNTAFIYLAEWIDATGGVLTNIQDDLAEIKTSKKVIPEKQQNKVINNNEFTQDFSKLSERLTLLQENIDSVKTEEISEIKSLLTGIMVQLNTALTPDIDSLNERIDKLCEDNGNKLTSLEELLQQKVEEQERKISSLEEKIDGMSQKFDKLIEVMSDDSHNYEIKDILNFLANQINTNVVNLQNTNNTVNEVAQKLENFDSNINKIVSYIEEE